MSAQAGGFADCPENLREAALWHASKGRPVFPVFFQAQPDGKVAKRPLTPHGFHDATTEITQITKWWTKWPGAGIGMPCGPASGLMAIDYDIDEGVDVQEVRESFHERFDLPQTLLVGSIRGGLHEYLKYAPDVGRQIHAIHPAVDILGEGGYVVLPPSRMEDGRAYKVLFDTEPCDATESLLAAIREGKGQPNLVAIDGALSSDERKKDAQYWDELNEPHKWHVAQRTLIARYIFRGHDPQLLLQIAPAFRRSPYTIEQTVKEIGDSIRGAVRKYTPAKQQDGRQTIPRIPLAEIGLAGPPEWRVPGLIPKKGFGVLYGASGTFKSFIALDLALSVAHGLPWRGKPTERAPTVYIAAEGTYGIQSRVVVWREHRGKQAEAPGDFWLVPAALNLRDNAVTDALLECLAEVRPAFTIVDTLSRSFGGGQENDNQDMGLFVANCDRIAAATGGFVLAIHHTGKDEGKGARGSSVLKAAADVEISVSRGTGERSAIVRVTKMKDAEDGARVGIRLVSVESVMPVTGEIISSLLPVIDEAPATQGQKPSRLGRNERVVLASLENARPLRFGQVMAATGIESGNLGRCLRGLLEKGLVTQDGEAWDLPTVVCENGEET